ncbi:Kdo hydroxylase family protein [Methyloradius palustris]|uniref:3-deoxy-D-manno-oct-2-ulosonic acid (Kdo) hydroxylase n=1 Tax=Methyloradius palustris TaxID=2778876 RepID=A0A8D5G1X3_9PROT|nr:Kdo hydroxylase family protein [Methyloradius palustris]BCM24578.1 hypothetical protein ZMTM_08370 [Methyloradius palustris]
MNILHTFDFESWRPDIDKALRHRAVSALEGGGVIFMPALTFSLKEDEKRFLSPAWSDGKSKNISLRPNGGLKGAIGNEEELNALQRMIHRYATETTALIHTLYPEYTPYLQPANTSFRPCEVENRKSSYRKDDSRLHADAFPSNPTQGLRLLRVFTNINPDGRPRQWRVGEPFIDMAAKYLPDTKSMLPGQAKLMHVLNITKKRRTPYDHLMLQLHDKVKWDIEYQKNAPQQHVDFPPGSTWIVFSDQVLHAAMAGQYMMEQTFYLPVDALYNPQTAPIRVLESMLNKSLA